MLSGFRPGPPVRGAFFCLTAWCGRGGIGGPPPALFGPPPGPPPPPRWPVLAPPGSALGPRRYAARSGPACAGPALFAPPRLAPGSPVGGAGRPPGRPVGPLRWSSGAGARPPAASGAFPCPAWALAAGPPLGGLAWCLPWLGAAPCSPPGGGVGPLAPPPGGRHCWPLLLAPEDLERRRRTASRRSVSMSAMA